MNIEDLRVPGAGIRPARPEGQGILSPSLGPGLVATVESGQVPRNGAGSTGRCNTLLIC